MLSWWDGRFMLGSSKEVIVSDDFFDLALERASRQGQPSDLCACRLSKLAYQHSNKFVGIDF
jgi:hypothetical protein